MNVQTRHIQYTPNFHKSSTRSHASEDEYRTIDKCKRFLTFLFTNITFIQFFLQYLG